MNESLREVNAILTKIRSGRAGRDEAIVQLYKDQKLRNGFKKMITTEGWPKSTFDTIFTDAIIAFASSVIRRKDFQLNSNLRNYILVIGKRAYRRKNAKKFMTTSLDEIGDVKIEDDIAMDLIINDEHRELVQMVLSRLGRNCREVLTYWASEYNMKEIADLMGYKSDMMARKKKYKCFKELMELVEKYPNIEDLLRTHE